MGFTPSTPAGNLPSRGGLSPLKVLGLTPETRCWSEVRQAFISRLRQFPLEQHPEEFVLIVDAYHTLKRVFAEASGSDAESSGPAPKRRKAEATWGRFPSSVMTLDCSGIVHDRPAEPLSAGEGAGGLAAMPGREAPPGAAVGFLGGAGFARSSSSGCPGGGATMFCPPVRQVTDSSASNAMCIG
ncbi:unnamed protein product [Polarella glacialis]|uniref:J domain-containing protein n=2 Tax=Polarella glacialis TaxID=89957 RepID=A0A813FC79_POLGL|nr:unnamed protein product [Polarella glacialis]